jgi:uncharacterized delta-60 repeat protein
MKKIKFYLFFFSFFLSSNFINSQQAGTLDLTFNNGKGYKFFNTRVGLLGQFTGSCALLQTDGKIIIGGSYAVDIGNNIFAFKQSVMRLNADATLDLTFGTNGFSIIYNPAIVNPSDHIGNPDSVNYMTLQPDGKILLVNNTYSNTPKIIAYRLNNNGSLDASFGVNGIAAIDTGFESNGALAVKVLPNNKILIGGGMGQVATGSEARLLRLLPNGTLDTTFGINGVTPAVNGNGTLAYQSAIKVIGFQNDGKIVCSGDFNSVNNTNNNFFTVRYNPNGTLDTTFGINGLAQTVTSTGYDFANNQIIQPDGKILTIGTGEGITLVRLNTDGSLDNTFNPNAIEPGIVNNTFDGYNTRRGFSLLLQPNGKIVVVGNFIGSTIGRLNPDGSLDTTFNDIGYTKSSYTEISNLGDVYHTLLQLPDGKFLVIGEAYFVEDNLSFTYTTVSRYNSDLNLSNETFNKNKVTLFPNPTNNKSFFDNSQNKYNNVEIFNYLGQQVGNQKMQFSNNLEIDLSKFSTGIYVLKMSNENESVSVKVVKE